MGARAALVVLVLLLLGLAGTGGLDGGLDRVLRPLSPEVTREALHRIQTRAAAAYVVARGLGRVVAVASSATVNAGIAVGGSLDIGRVLDPVDKLLDTFADVMMVSLISVTTQLILLDVLDAYALRWLLPAGLLVLALALALASPAHGRLRRIASLLIVAALLAKYALPLSVAGTEALSARFLEPRAAAAEQVVRATESDVAAHTAPGAEDHAWYDPRQLGDNLDALAPNRFMRQVEQAVDAMLAWMTVFVLETMLMPAGIALAVIAFARAAARRVALVVP
jgi:hypothetical protein